jgi:hypothetical protein
MTSALTPALALAYLHQLSADIRAAVVLGATGATACEQTRGRAETPAEAAARPHGEMSAGPESPAGTAARRHGEMSAGPETPAGTAAPGRADVVRSWSVLAGPEALAAPACALLAHGSLVHAHATAGAAFGARGARVAVVVVTGRLALPGLTAHDLCAALAALGDEPPADAPVNAPAETAEALLAAV